ncbi:hypothetical protein B0A49_11779 [Cryomyces minteri]|uniref:N-acetyltransferase domain-containing protein n=1 Tax=Cryomyces minteri TaxID=331657 RepID=A0A4U0WYK9_9PEZI|nr:hypothetical protein B0A49_11779 [Cryomyces minteri]
MASTSPPLIRLRAARQDDVPAIATLGAHIFAVTFGHSVPASELQSYLLEFYSEAATSKDVEDPLKDLVVAVDEAEVIVGFALLTRGTSEPCIANLENAIELQRVYVDPMCAGQGVGRMLIGRLEEMARERDFKHIWLGVWEENIKAQEVYKRLGYSAVGDHDFTIGGIVQTDYVMLKTL